MAGCVAQAEGAEIMRRAPYVDLVAGPQTYHRLPEFLARARAGKKPVETDFLAESKFESLPMARPDARKPVASFVSIQEGCDKFCAFCVVPYTRGAEYSRPAEQVLREIEALANSGAREISLLGQNVNAWRGQGLDGKAWTLEKLIAKIAGLRGIARIRYTTSHPNDMTDALIEAHRDIPKLMPYLHLPVQSGSDRILAAMNRKHTRRDYLAIIEKVRRARPDIALSSDFITGFPGETETDFADTMALAREVNFAMAYSFKYSARPGTPAEGAGNQIEESVSARRLGQLQALLLGQQREFNQAAVGRTIDILVEKTGRNPGQIGGRTPWNQAAHFEGDAALTGKTVSIEVTGLTANSLAARLAPARLQDREAQL